MKKNIKLSNIENSIEIHVAILLTFTEYKVPNRRATRTEKNKGGEPDIIPHATDCMQNNCNRLIICDLSIN